MTEEELKIYNDMKDEYNKLEEELYKKKEELRLFKIETTRLYNREYSLKHWDNRLLRTCKQIDKNENRLFNLDEEWIKRMLEVQNGICYQCSYPFLLINGDRDLRQVSIDRIDNDLGHIKGNVILSCWGCNCTRGDKPFDYLGSSYDMVLYADI